MNQLVCTSQSKTPRRSTRRLTFLLYNRDSWACIIDFFTFYSLACFAWCSSSILPKRFTKLRNDLPACVSCLFRQSYRFPWRHKSSALNTSGVFCGKNFTQPGRSIDEDQLVSAQPGPVPQEKGTLTRARIWGATIFVDYVTKWVRGILEETELWHEEVFWKKCNSGLQHKR